MACSDGYKTQHIASEYSYSLGKKCSICILVSVLCDILLHYIFLKFSSEFYIRKFRVCKSVYLHKLK